MDFLRVPELFLFDFLSKLVSSGCQSNQRRRRAPAPALGLGLGLGEGAGAGAGAGWHVVDTDDLIAGLDGRISALREQGEG